MISVVLILTTIMYIISIIMKWILWNFVSPNAIYNVWWNY